MDIETKEFCSDALPDLYQMKRKKLFWICPS